MSGSNIPVQPPAGYDRIHWRARYGLGPDDLLLAYFGFLKESKGGEALIRTLYKLVAESPFGPGANSHLLMVGGQISSVYVWVRTTDQGEYGTLLEIGTAEAEG